MISKNLRAMILRDIIAIKVPTNIGKPKIEPGTLEITPVKLEIPPNCKLILINDDGEEVLLAKGAEL